MSLVHYVKPFLDLGICKEYCMARKTTGNTTTSRSKKTASLGQPVPVQVATDVPKEVAKSGKPVRIATVNLEEEIRRRAYELYLQRRATAGGDNGNPNQDWLIAEREIRSRNGEHHTA